MRKIQIVTRGAAAAALVMAGSLSLAPAGQATGAAVTVPTGQNLESVSVDDGAGVINEQRLRDALDEIDFNEPTKVAIYTREGKYSDNINTETLKYARDVHPEWISQKEEDYGDYWADGIFIITLSIEGERTGQVGTYYGEDRKVSTSQMETIHEAGFADFKVARWTDGVIEIADQGARIMNRPWYLSPGLWWTTAIGGGGGLLIWWAALAMRASRRKNFASAFEKGRKHLTNVTLDLQSTELAARTLPTGSRHAADLERRFADFMAKYRVSFEAQQELEASDKKLRSSSKGVNRAEVFSSTAANLDATDDAIIAAAALYTRSASWEDAWRAQTAPLLEDLAELPELTSDSAQGTEPARAALDSFGHSAKQRVEQIGTDLKSETIDVDTALDQLAELRQELTEKLEVLSAAQIEAFAKTKDEKEDMRRQMAKARDKRDSVHAGGSILDVTGSAGFFWRVNAYNIGYNSGVDAVKSSRQAASSSSSGISSGYSGGGGSFSGAGGSSRF